ncbi:CAP domain-containing protein [Okeania sp.]|uniref:CAP domain-containing protein n=1 Tax=Okeania sp. TaxID=3100323 RepID=UPI002B4AF0A5|nr:CAP domain-containing protein [Okeania sp.]MEB3342232.1 CAP domain-containing protein [Okeania sp.]
MNHQYLQQVLWSLTIFLSSFNYQKLIPNLPEIPTLKLTYLSQSNTVDSPYNEMEQSVFNYVNQHRNSQNLPTLQWNYTIAEQAKIHAQQMASGQTTFSNNGFKERVEIISEKIPYKSAAENIAEEEKNGYNDPVRKAVVGWINSPEHRQNMEGDYNLTGVGIAQSSDGTYYFNQMFIKTR